jgi:hypothetical protein
MAKIAEIARTANVVAFFITDSHTLVPPDRLDIVVIAMHSLL